MPNPNNHAVSAHSCQRMSWAFRHGSPRERTVTTRSTATKHSRCGNVLAAIAVTIVVCGIATNSCRGQPAVRSTLGYQNLLRFQEQYKDRRQKFFNDLEEFRNRCLDERANDEADEVEALIEKSRADDVEFASLPDDVIPPISGDLPAAEISRRKELLRLRTEYAGDLVILAQKARKQRHLSLTYALIREAAIHDPDHPTARRMLGFVRQGDQWVTPIAQAMLKEKKIWHPSFGWIPRAHVDRYENGERFFNNSWMSKLKEAELRQNFDNAWEVRTDHYLIKTNHSLERGVEIGLALEEFYRYFMQTFSGFFDSPDQINALLPGGARRSALFRPYEVHYYRTKEEYNQRLISKIPQIDITNGLYYTSDRVAYFFDDPNANGLATLYHEASHQLFYESQAKDRTPGEAAHFWIIEGIACYVESFHVSEGMVSIGDPRFDRFRAARIRLLRDEYYVPLEEFSSMGMQAFQTDVKNIQMNYSQASGLAHFFMNYNDGEYRDALITHLSQLYDANRRGRNVDTLAELTGIPYAILDRQYKTYMQEMEAAVNDSSR